MKKCLMLLIAVMLSLASFAGSVPKWDKPLIPKCKKVFTPYITSDYLYDGHSNMHYIYYHCYFSEAATVDYRVTVGVWMYHKPYNQIGWHWAYKYFNLIVPAGEVWWPNSYSQWICSVGELVDEDNYYVSNFQPN